MLFQSRLLAFGSAALAQCWFDFEELIKRSSSRVVPFQTRVDGEVSERLTSAGEHRGSAPPVWGRFHPPWGSALTPYWGTPRGQGMRDAVTTGTARGCPSHPPHPSGRDGGRGHRPAEGPARRRGRRDGRGEQPVRGEGQCRAGPSWAGPGAWLAARRGGGRPQPLALRHSRGRSAHRGAGGQRPAPRHGRPGRQRPPGGHHLRLRRWVAPRMERGGLQGAPTEGARVGAAAFGARPGGAAAAGERGELGSVSPGLGCCGFPELLAPRWDPGGSWPGLRVAPRGWGGLEGAGCPRAASVPFVRSGCAPWYLPRQGLKGMFLLSCPSRVDLCRFFGWKHPPDQTASLKEKPGRGPSVDSQLWGANTAVE